MSPGSPGELSAADVASFGVYKQQFFLQSGNSAPTAHPDFPHGFRVFATATQSGSIESTTLQFPPSNTPQAIDGGANGVDFETEAAFATKAELDAAAGNGLFRFGFTGTSDGSFNSGVLLSFTDAYPSTPRLLAVPSVGGYSPDSAFTFEWAPFEGGRAVDIIQFVLIDTVTGLRVFDTGSPVDAVRLNGLASEATLPAGVLQDGRRYTGLLGFFRITGTTISIGDAFGVAAFGKTTAFELQTAGLTDAPSIAFAGLEEGNIKLRVSAVEFIPLAIQMSDDLIEWTTVFTTTPIVGSFLHRVPLSESAGPVMFRAVTNP